MSNAVYPAASASAQVRGLAYSVVKRPGFNTLPQKGPNFYETRISQARNPEWRWTLTYELLWDKLSKINSAALAAYTDLQILMGFFLNRSGHFDSFLFDDPDDDSVGPGVVTSGWTPTTYYPVNSSLLVGGHWQKATVGGVSGASAPAFSTGGGTVSEGAGRPSWQDQGAGFTQVPNLGAQLQVVQDSATGTYYSPVQRNLGGFWEDVTDLQAGITVYDKGTVVSPTLSTTPGLAITGASYMGQYLTWGAGYVPNVSAVTATFKFYFRVTFESDEVDFEKFMNQLWTVGGSEGKGGKGEIVLVSSRPPNV